MARVSNEVLVDRLARLALGEPLAAARAAALAHDLDTHALSVDALVDVLMTDPRVATRTAPTVLLTEHVAPANWFEQHDAVLSVRDGVYVLGKKSCPSADAVNVHPWWALDSTVLVCKRDYQPERFHGASALACAAQNGAPPCGCGPNLMLCMRDNAQFDVVGRSVVDEVRRTVAYAVTHDRSLDWIFTTNATVRDGLAEFNYDRQRALRGEIPMVHDYRAWHDDGEPVARFEPAPGAHAGILTTSQLVFHHDASRLRQTDYGDLLWCWSARSLHTQTEVILKLGTTNLRDGEGWQALAKMPFCTDCHARMDYGMQFFLGYPRGLDGYVFDPKLARAGQGQLFLRNINDERGSADLTPAGYATLAVAQPEFAACMAQRVSDHVFGGELTPRAAALVRDAYDRTHLFQPMLRIALLELAHSLRDGASVASAAPAAQPATVAPGQVVLPSALHEIVSSACVSCHDEGARDMQPSTLPRPLVIDMLNQAAMHTMPRASAPGMDPALRRSLVIGLAEALFVDDARVQARRYFLDVVDRTSLFDAETIRRGIATRSQGTPQAGAWSVPEADRAPGDRVYTPTLAASHALEVLRQCKATAKSAAALETCIAKSFRIDDAVVAP